MSIKNSALLAAVTVLTLGDSICESLVNDKPVNSFELFEVDASGRVAAVAVVDMGAQPDVFRPVADANGDVKLYASAVAALNMARRNGRDVGVSFTPFIRTVAIGDPVKSLIAKHKSYKTEDASAAKSVAAVATKVSAAAALGWDVAVGTPEADEYADIIKRQTAIAEWKAFTAAKVVALTASLVAANIDPVTYLPTP